MSPDFGDAFSFATYGFNDFGDVAKFLGLTFTTMIVALSLLRLAVEAARWLGLVGSRLWWATLTMLSNFYQFLTDFSPREVVIAEDKEGTLIDDVWIPTGTVRYLKAAGKLNAVVHVDSKIVCVLPADDYSSASSNAGSTDSRFERSYEMSQPGSPYIGTSTFPSYMVAFYTESRQFLGFGSRVDISGRDFIVSAAHVLESARFIGVANTAQMLQLRPDILNCGPEEEDIGVMDFEKLPVRTSLFGLTKAKTGPSRRHLIVDAYGHCRGERSKTSGRIVGKDPTHFACLIHSASTLPGWSGTPIIDLKGRVIAVHVAAREKRNECYALDAVAVYLRLKIQESGHEANDAYFQRLEDADDIQNRMLNDVHHYRGEGIVFGEDSRYWYTTEDGDDLFNVEQMLFNKGYAAEDFTDQELHVLKHTGKVRGRALESANVGSIESDVPMLSANDTARQQVQEHLPSKVTASPPLNRSEPKKTARASQKTPLTGSTPSASTQSSISKRQQKKLRQLKAQEQSLEEQVMALSVQLTAVQETMTSLGSQTMN